MLPRPKLGDDKYPALTGVRALGAAVVYFDHFPFVADAHLTVNVMAFFFALSGFLIFRIYYEQLQLNRGFAARYFVNRFARIYPVYFLLLTVAVWLGHEIRPWVLVKNYTLTHALFHPTQAVIEPSWSLTVEECFYLLAPFFMLLVRRFGFIALVLAGSALLASALGIARLPLYFLHTTGFVLTTTFFGHFLEFFAGIYLALAVMRIEKREPIAAKGYKWTAWGVAAVAMLSVAMMEVYAHPPLNMRLIVVLNNFLIPVPIAILYWGLIRERTVLSRMLSSKFMALLGRSSYTFYLLHMLVIDYLAVPRLLPLIGSRPASVMIAFIITWVLSILIFMIFEEPMNLSIRGAFQRWFPRPVMQHG